MQLSRPVFAQHPLRFGRGPVRVVEQAPRISETLANDIKLFAGTFLAGFLFVSILIG